MLLALTLAAGLAPAPATRPVGFGMARDFTLHFEHNLGAEEAKRRVAARIESLRQKFGRRLEKSDVSWNGNEADVRVRALSQGANGHITVGASSVDVRVHLPMLLGPFGDEVRRVLNTAAFAALKESAR